MVKSSGPSVNLDLPALAECSECQGSGKIKPMFHEMPCHSCAGAGVVDAVTGEPVPSEKLIPAMKASISKLKNSNFYLREQLKGCECHRPKEPMRKRHGGVHRMD